MIQASRVTVESPEEMLPEHPSQGVMEALGVSIADPPSLSPQADLGPGFGFLLRVPLSTSA